MLGSSFPLVLEKQMHRYAWAEKISGQLGQDYFAYTLKRTYHLHFFLTYHAFKSREGIASQTNIDILDIREQKTHRLYIYYSVTKPLIIAYS